MKRYGIYAAIILVFVVNAIVLAGVQYNRSGEPDAVIALTERELNVAYAHKENSGVSLSLNWNRRPGGEQAWFGRTRLEEVGYDCSRPLEGPDAERWYRKSLQRKAYAVLEYDGPAWKAWIAAEQRKIESMKADVAAGKVAAKTVENAQKRLVWDEAAASRLVAVDVGMDPKKMRQRYADRNRYIITPALVRLNYRYPVKDKGVVREPARLSGSITSILTESIHVPSDVQGRLAALQKKGDSFRYYSYYEGMKDEKPKPPRFSVSLVYGKRFEPWVGWVRMASAE